MSKSEHSSPVKFVRVYQNILNNNQIIRKQNKSCHKISNNCQRKLDNHRQILKNNEKNTKQQQRLTKKNYTMHCMNTKNNKNPKPIQSHQVYQNLNMKSKNFSFSSKKLTSSPFINNIVKHHHSVHKNKQLSYENKILKHEQQILNELQIQLIHINKKIDEQYTKNKLLTQLQQIMLSNNHFSLRISPITTPPTTSFQSYNFSQLFHLKSQSLTHFIKSLTRQRNLLELSNKQIKQQIFMFRKSRVIFSSLFKEIQKQLKVNQRIFIEFMGRNQDGIKEAERLMIKKNGNGEDKCNKGNTKCNKGPVVSFKEDYSQFNTNRNNVNKNIKQIHSTPHPVILSHSPPINPTILTIFQNLFSYNFPPQFSQQLLTLSQSSSSLLTQLNQLLYQIQKISLHFDLNIKYIEIYKEKYKKIKILSIADSFMSVSDKKKQNSVNSDLLNINWSSNSNSNMNMNMSNSNMNMSMSNSNNKSRIKLQSKFSYFQQQTPAKTSNKNNNTMISFNRQNSNLHISMHDQPLLSQSIHHPKPSHFSNLQHQPTQIIPQSQSPQTTIFYHHFTLIQLIHSKTEYISYKNHYYHQKITQYDSLIGLYENQIKFKQMQYQNNLYVKEYQKEIKDKQVDDQLLMAMLNMEKDDKICYEKILDIQQIKEYFQYVKQNKQEQHDYQQYQYNNQQQQQHQLLLFISKLQQQYQTTILSTSFDHIIKINCHINPKSQFILMQNCILQQQQQHQPSFQQQQQSSSPLNNILQSIFISEPYEKAFTRNQLEKQCKKITKQFIWKNKKSIGLNTIKQMDFDVKENKKSIKNLERKHFKDIQTQNNIKSIKTFKNIQNLKQNTFQSKEKQNKKIIKTLNNLGNVQATNRSLNNSNHIKIKGNKKVQIQLKQKCQKKQLSYNQSYNQPINQKYPIIFM